LGNFYREQRNFSSADEAFQEALQIGPSASLYASMALSYYDQSRFSESEHCILKAIKLEPNNSMFYFIYAMLSAFQGKYHSAELLYKKAIELDPHFYNAYAELGWLYKNKMHFVGDKKFF